MPNGAIDATADAACEQSRLQYLWPIGSSPNGPAALFTPHVRQGFERPNAAALTRGIAALTDRKVANRLPKVEHPIALLEEIELIVAENVRREWGTPPADLYRREDAEHCERDLDGERAVAIMDRLLLRLHHYEADWERFGRNPDRLWRNRWEDAGMELLRDLGRLAHERELLQVMRTLLRERVGR